MGILILVLEIIGTVVFSISGALTGMKKNMDVFGVAFLGWVTAMGGGVLRDVILGNTPPVAFREPTNSVIAISVAVIAFFIARRHLVNKHPVLWDRLLFIMDTLGLAIFTVVGVKVAYGVITEHRLFLTVCVGVLTGVGGGVLRDVLAGNIPYIFVKHIYACASIAGAIVCALLWRWSGETAAVLSGAAVIVVIRCISAHYRLSLPKMDNRR